MTKEEKQIEAKMRELEEAARRNERMMRKTFMKYEDLIAENASLIAGIEALRAFREQRRRNALKAVFISKPDSRNGGQSRQFFSAERPGTLIQWQAVRHQIGK